MLKKKLPKSKLLLLLARKDDISNMPSEEELNKELVEMFKIVLLTEDRKEQIRQLDLKSKWKLVKNHKKFMDSNKEALKMSSSKEIMAVVNKIKQKASLFDIQEIKRWILKATEFQVRCFCIYDGVKYLFQRLSEAEMISRTNKSFLKQIEILKLLELISKLENGVEETLKCKNSLYYLLLNLHPYNVELTSITIEILDNIVWESNLAIDLLLDSLTKIKNERNYQNRFYPFLQCIMNAKSLMVINAVTLFINDFISAPNDEKKRFEMRSEVINCGIMEAYEVFSVF